MIYQCRTVEAPWDQLVARVVPGILDGEFLEQTEVYTKDVIRPRYNLLDATDHAPYPSIPCPVAATR